VRVFHLPLHQFGDLHPQLRPPVLEELFGGAVELTLRVGMVDPLQ